MIGRWMLYTLVVSAVITIAAWAAEAVLRLWRKEGRWSWAAAMGASIVGPAVALAQAAGWLGTVRVSPVISVLPGGLALLPPIEVVARTPMIDAAIGLAWLLASLALGGRLLVAARALHARRVAWRAATLDGQPVLVSPDAGPAVIGFRCPTVVVPEWVLTLDAALRALVLRHEREHLDRGDPRLLLGAVSVAVCMPWNPLIWFQLHRLRAAMEMDCDARVLRAYPDTRRYGSLLLAVAQRSDRVGLLTPALTESKSLLARRITAMRLAIPRRRLARTLMLVAFAGVATAVACEVQAPSQPPMQLPSSRLVVASEPYFEFQVEQPVTPAPGSTSPRYPDALRRANIEGEVLAQFVVDRDGLAMPGTFKALRSTNDAFTTAVSNALPQMRFNPALVGGKAVRQLVQQPFTFSISK